MTAATRTPICVQQMNDWLRTVRFPISPNHIIYASRAIIKYIQYDFWLFGFRLRITYQTWFNRIDIGRVAAGVCRFNYYSITDNNKSAIGITCRDFRPNTSLHFFFVYLRSVFAWYAFSREPIFAIYIGTCIACAYYTTDGERMSTAVRRPAITVRLCYYILYYHRFCR